MKRFVCLMLSLLLLAAFAGCRGTEPAPSADPSEEHVPLPENEVPGTLLYMPLSMRYPGVDALALSGDRAGSAEYNSKAPAKEGIRCVFEQGENIGFTLETTDLSGSLTVCLFAHREFKDYKHVSLSDALSSAVCDIASVTSGSLAAPADAAPGWYDLIFAVDGSMVSVCYVRLFAAGTLAGLSDGELDKLAG